METCVIDRKNIPSCLVPKHKQEMVKVEGKDFEQVQHLIKCEATCELRGLCRFTHWMEFTDIPPEKD